MGRGIVISVVGTHAGEELKQIFRRKKKEIRKLGYTYWLYKSHSAKPNTVQKLAKFNNNDLACYFISASAESGARPTKEQAISRYYSVDGSKWQQIPKDILVTGSSKFAFALVLKEVTLVEKIVDLWDYSSFTNPNNPITIRLGDSTLPVIKSLKKHQNKIKSHIRRVIAVGKLKSPFCVWLKAEIS